MSIFFRLLKITFGQLENRLLLTLSELSTKISVIFTEVDTFRSCVSDGKAEHHFPHSS